MKVEVTYGLDTACSITQSISSPVDCKPEFENGFVKLTATDPETKEIQEYYINASLVINMVVVSKREL